ncbi:MAG: HAD family hydrolase [Nanoarchaeota archaeon]|nr:HAD family hydrolase [Nanoarchaeota archaeon]
MQIQVNAVIFDWGNTLCHSPFKRVLEKKNDEFLEILNKRDYPIDKEKLFDTWFKADTETKFPHHSHSFQEEKTVRQALKYMGVTAPHIREMCPKLLDVYMEGVKDVMTNDPHNQEVRLAFEDLRSRGKKIAIFSNGRSKVPITWLEWAGIPKEWFTFILASEEVEIEKPDLRIFGLIADRAGEPVDKCVYVGNDPIKDINPALGYGMKTILYKTPEEYRREKLTEKYNQGTSADATITKFSELKEIII